MRRSLSTGLLLFALPLACSNDDDAASGTDDGASTGSAETIEVSGDAFAFSLPGTPYGRMDTAMVSIVEQPELVVTSDAMGHFDFPAVPAGSTATFEIMRDGFPRARTKTFTIPATGPLERVTFQVPDDSLYT